MSSRHWVYSSLWVTVWYTVLWGGEVWEGNGLPDEHFLELPRTFLEHFPRTPLRILKNLVLGTEDRIFQELVNFQRHPYISLLSVALISIYLLLLFRCSVMSSSLQESCMDCRMPGFPFLYPLLELAQTHVHWVGDTIQPCHPLLSPSPPALSLSQHQGLFQWVSSLHHVAKVLKFQLQNQFFQWTPRTDLL